MPNAVAVIGLTFRAADLQRSDFSVFLEIIKGLNDLPSVRGTDVVVPGLTGRIVRNRVADKRDIVLSGFVRGVGGSPTESSDRAAFRVVMDEMRTLFDPTLTPGDLIATLENGSTARIAARTLNLIEDNQLPTLSKINVELESVAPNWSTPGNLAPLPVPVILTVPNPTVTVS